MKEKSYDFKIKLRECPFCGKMPRTDILNSSGYGFIQLTFYIECETCNFNLKERTHGEWVSFEDGIITMARLVEKWNRGEPCNDKKDAPDKEVYKYIV